MMDVVEQLFLATFHINWCTLQFSWQTSPNWYGTAPPDYKLFYNELYVSRYLHARRHVYNATVNINLKNLILVFYSGLSIKLVGNHSSDLTKRRHWKLMKKAIFHFQFGFRKSYSTVHASEIAGKQYDDYLHIVVEYLQNLQKLFILSTTNIVEETIIIWN